MQSLVIFSRALIFKILLLLILVGAMAFTLHFIEAAAQEFDFSSGKKTTGELTSGRQPFDTSGDSRSTNIALVRNDEALNICFSAPSAGGHAPTQPQILSPFSGAQVKDLAPKLAVDGSKDADGDCLSYEFELYDDGSLKNLLAAGISLIAADGRVYWTIPKPLSDNHDYVWRVRASDGITYSPWAYGRFFVNQANDPPEAFAIAYPADGTNVSYRRPELTVNCSRDPDNEELRYIFELYSDEALTKRAAVSQPLSANGDDAFVTWTVPINLTDGENYFWRVRALDGAGAGVYTAPGRFKVDITNTAPPMPVIVDPLPGSEIDSQSVALKIKSGCDVDGDDLFYFFEMDEDPFFISPKMIASPAVAAEGERGVWRVNGLDDYKVYYWRAKSFDGSAESPWIYGWVKGNRANEAPEIPQPYNPGNDIWVGTLTPRLNVAPVTDPHGEPVTYSFELHSENPLSPPLRVHMSCEPFWQLTEPLCDTAAYSWRVQAVDARGKKSSWSPISRFYVNTQGVNQAPAFEWPTTERELVTSAETLELAWQADDPDSDATVSLYYDRDGSGMDGSLIVADLKVGRTPEKKKYTWKIAGLSGTYHLYAVITDGATTECVYAPWRVIVDRQAPNVSADPVSGIFETPFMVILSANENAKIYYTMDGSEPTSAAEAYVAPLTISATTMLKFMAMDSAGNSGPVQTMTYLMGSKSIKLSGLTLRNAHLPILRFGGYPADGSELE